ncbi:MAG: STAS-like domain-containing protein [Elusimicrobia bacterium]|nr:STAS-like domain-containing protein [Elusimicrobiota bacterium]
MKIKVKKYGEILTSRPAGKEAALAMKAYQRPAGNEKIELDFEGVLSVGPSWLDEVLSALRREYGRDRVICLPSKNPSVIESLKVIDA